MSSLFYHCYCSVNQNEILKIDKKVHSNRTHIWKSSRGLRIKTNKMLINLGLAAQISGTSLPVLDAISVPFFPIPTGTHRLINNRKYELAPTVCKYAETCFDGNKQVDKIQLTNIQIRKFDDFANQLYRREITLEQALIQVRGGGCEIILLVGFLYFLNWYDSKFYGEAFIPDLPPHHDLLGWLNRKYKHQPRSNNQQCFAPSIFDKGTINQMNQMCHITADQEGFFMTRDEALQHIRETYTESTQITKTCKVSDWQIAKKSYHFAEQFGINLNNYKDFTKDDLKQLHNIKGGLVNYIRKGGKLPPVEFVKNARQQLVNFCQDESTQIIEDATHYSGDSDETPAIMFHNNGTGRIAIFNWTSEDFITTETFPERVFNQYVDGKYLGSLTKK